MFISSGLCAAANTGSPENVFATINADGTIGTFGGATGSNTLLSVDKEPGVGCLAEEKLVRRSRALRGLPSRNILRPRVPLP